MKKSLIAPLIIVFSTPAVASNQYKIIFDNTTFKEMIPEGQTHYQSCNDILQNGESNGDGTYTINPTGDAEINVYCDMTTDGGGWTKITKDLIQQHFTTDFNERVGYSEWRNNKLVAGDINNDNGTDTIININLPFKYSEFYLNNFYWQDIDTNDGGTWDAYTNLKNIDYKTHFDTTSGTTGDITIGTFSNNAATLSFYNQHGNKQGEGSSFKVPVDGQIFSNPVSSSTLTFRAMERGGENEEAYIWSEGSIWVR